jgi:hypothetical protein
LNMARKASLEASSAMRCAWKARPSTMNVTSLSVGLLTYCDDQQGAPGKEDWCCCHTMQSNADNSDKAGSK